MCRRLDFSMSSIQDVGQLKRSDGSYTQRAILRVADIVDGDRLPGLTFAGDVVEDYRATCPEDHERARLRLYRAARDRLRELAVQNQRECE